MSKLFVHALLTPITQGLINVWMNRDWIVFAERGEINVSTAQSGSFTTSGSRDHIVTAFIDKVQWE